MINTNIVKYVLAASMRDKVVLSLVVAICLIVSMSFFVGSSSVIEQQQFSLIYMASGLRLFVMLGLSLFVVFFIRRSDEGRDLEFLLSRPITRPVFILSHSFAFITLCLFFTCVVGAVLFVSGRGMWTDGYGLWMLGFFMELCIIVTSAFFFSMVLKNAVSGLLSVFAFYALSRMIGQMLGIAQGYIIQGNLDFVNELMKIIALFIPRLDLLVQSNWLIYDVSSDSIGGLYIVFQGIVFTAILTVATVLDLKRKEF